MVLSTHPQATAPHTSTSKPPISPLSEAHNTMEMAKSLSLEVIAAVNILLGPADDQLKRQNGENAAGVLWALNEHATEVRHSISRAFDALARLKSVL